MTILQKQNASVHGITPFYYILFDSNRQANFNDILGYTNIDLSIDFIDAVIEIVEFIEKRYITQKDDDLTPEQISIIRNKNLVMPLLDLYGRTLRYSIKDLRDIKKDLLLAYDIDDDINIGSLSFNELFKLNKDVMENNLKVELNNLAIHTDESGEYINFNEGIERLDEFSKNLSIAIGLVEKRIKRIEERAKPVKGGVLQSKFKEIINQVEYWDAILLGEVRGQINEQQKLKSNILRQAFASIGIDTSTQKYAIVHSNMNYVSNLDKKTYNQKIVPQMEDKKHSLEILRVETVTRISSLKEDNKVDIFHF